MSERKRPHIIIFNPDEMRASSLAHLGNPAAVTPELDRFAAEDAVSFSHAYCQNPVCVPSRCSFFTGLYPHVHDHRTMSHLLRPGESSLFSELKRDGYYVWMNDRNDLVAGEFAGLADEHADEIYYGGQKPKGPGPKDRGLRGERGGKNYYSHFDGELALGADGHNYSGDDEAVDAAIVRICDRPEDKPLCMFLGLVWPHVPYCAEEPYFSAVDRSKLPARIKASECSGKSRMLDAIRENAGMEGYTEADWDELRAVYLGMCMKVDAQFGRLVAALKDEGIYEDCAIFFLSDHGDFCGDYDLPEKAQNRIEDCLVRVPLLIKPPKGVDVDPGVADGPVELVDFYATAMALAGTEPDHTQFGRSLLPMLADRSAQVRDLAFCEGGRVAGEKHCDEYSMPDDLGATTASSYWPRMKAQSEDLAHEKAVMVTDARYKYVKRLYGSDELYDLARDPGERTNVLDAPELADVRSRLRSAVLDWLLATDDVVPFEHDSRFTPEMLWAKVKALVPPGREEEVRSLIAEGASIQALFQYCFSLRGEAGRAV